MPIRIAKARGGPQVGKFAATVLMTSTASDHGPGGGGAGGPGDGDDGGYTKVTTAMTRAYTETSPVKPPRVTSRPPAAARQAWPGETASGSRAVEERQRRYSSSALGLY